MKIGILYAGDYDQEPFSILLNRIIGANDWPLPQIERSAANGNIAGSLPSLRRAYNIDKKELRVGIDPRRIPRKMLEQPIDQQEEPDAWIFSVSTPCLNCQNSV